MSYSGMFPLEYDNVPDHDDPVAVRAAQADPHAFQVLYQRYLPQVYRYVRTRSSNADDADDLTQQVFLQALDALPKYRERGLPFAAWLFRIARNVMIDAHRRKPITVIWDAVPEALLGLDAPDPETIAIRQEALTHLQTLLMRLDSDKRELLALRFAAGLTTREIAEVIGKREAAVKKQLARTLQALKEQYHAV